jgi:hypothetical protein
MFLLVQLMRAIILRHLYWNFNERHTYDRMTKLFFMINIQHITLHSPMECVKSSMMSIDSLVMHI